MVWPVDVSLTKKLDASLAKLGLDDVLSRKNQGFYWISYAGLDEKGDTRFWIKFYHDRPEIEVRVAADEEAYDMDDVALKLAVLL